MLMSQQEAVSLLESADADEANHSDHQEDEDIKKFRQVKIEQAARALLGLPDSDAGTCICIEAIHGMVTAAVASCCCIWCLQNLLLPVHRVRR